MIKFMQSYIFFIVLFLILILSSVSSVNSAEITVTSTYTTSQIQSLISTTTDDIIFEGEFNNLSKLNINRSIKISGKNATIVRNTSDTNNALFNITSSNVAIENLTIRGYNKTIFSNESNLSIQYNQITTNGVAINITTNSSLNTIIIKNNTITTNRSNAHGIYLYVINGSLENSSILYNTISTLGAHGIHLQTDHGNAKNNNIYGNTIKTNGSESRGVSLYANTGVVINNNISYNNINTTGSNSFGIYLFAFTYEMNNTTICGNDINVSSTAIRVGGGAATTSTINNLNISYNRIISNNIFINFTEAGGHGVNNTVSANWFGNNTPEMNKIIGINVLSYYVVNATPYKNNGIVGENWLINYTFYLNNTNNSGEFNKLPLFKAQLLNNSNIQISNRIAYNTGLWDVLIEHPKADEFTIVLDYEKILLGEIFTSDKGETTLTIDIDGELNINNTITINTILKNNQGQTLANKNITLIINGQKIGIQTTDSNGKATFNYTPTNSGTYNIQVIFEEDEDYNSSNDTKIITVQKIASSLNLTTEGNSEINQTIKLIATLTHNTPIAGETITFRLNGEIIGTNITDTNGEATFHYTFQNPGNYNFSSEYNGNIYYQPSNTALNGFNISAHENSTRITEPNNTATPQTNNTRIPETNNITTPQTNNTRIPETNNIATPETNNTTRPETNDIPTPETNNTTRPETNDVPTPETKNTSYKNKAVNNQGRNVTMKNTGIPIITLLIMLLINFGIIVSKKYKF